MISHGEDLKTMEWFVIPSFLFHISFQPFFSFVFHPILSSFVFLSFFLSFFFNTQTMMSGGGEEQPIVIDNGSSIIKAGFAGDKEPQFVFPSIVGHPCQRCVLLGFRGADSYVGDEAESKCAFLSFKHPIEHGMVTDWDDMEKIWRYTFHSLLRIVPEEHPILLAEAPFFTKQNKEKTAEMMIELFHFPAFQSESSGTLPLYASGRTTGIVLDIGGGACYTASVSKGFTLPHSMSCSCFGGNYLDEYLRTLFVERGLFLSPSPTDLEIIRGIKEKLCYVAPDFDAEMERAATSSDVDKSYELPNGDVVTLGNERFRCSECLFQPSLLGLEAVGVHEMIYNSIRNCGVFLQKDLFENIVVSGGSTMFEGFADRLKTEITALAPPTMKVNVVASSGRKYFTWLGGSILASQSYFKDKCITREEYYERGPSFVHFKRFC